MDSRARREPVLPTTVPPRTTGQRGRAAVVAAVAAIAFGLALGVRWLGGATPDTACLDLLAGVLAGWVLAAPPRERVAGGLALALAAGAVAFLLDGADLATSVAGVGAAAALAFAATAAAVTVPVVTRPLRSPAAVVRFAVLVAGVATALSTGVFALVAVALSFTMPSWAALASRWGGDVAGVLAFAPLTVVALAPGADRGRGVASRREVTAMLVAVAFVVGAVFGPWSHRLPAPLRHPHWTAPVVLWVGLRGGRLASAAAVAVVSLAVAVLTARGTGPLAVVGPSSEAVETQVFAGITAVLVGLVAAMRDRQQRLTANLARRGVRLARSVAEATRVATQLHTILDGMAETVVVCDVQGRVLLANEPALRGAGGERLRGGTFADYARAFRRYRADQRTPLEDHELPIARALRGESLHGELLWISPEGRPAQFVSCSARPIRDARGAIQAAVVVATDVSADVQVQMERERLVGELQRALAEIKVLRGVLPVCGYCHRIRDEHGGWVAFDVYVSQRSDAKFSHGICPACDAHVRGGDLGATPA